MDHRAVQPRASTADVRRDGLLQRVWCCCERCAAGCKDQEQEQTHRAQCAGSMDAGRRVEYWLPRFVRIISGCHRYGTVCGFIDLEDDAYLDTVISNSYPEQNCAAEFPNGGFGPIQDPQTVFPQYLTHTSSQTLVQPYLNTSFIAQQLGKEFMMFETNTASCGGFPGVSDSFGSALWAVDYGLQMAYSNFTGALLHVGGQNVSYNVSSLCAIHATAQTDGWMPPALYA